MTLPSRQQALADGSIHYMGGPCKHGHHGPRYTKTGMCCSCASIIARSPEKKTYDAERVARLRDKLSEQARQRYLLQRPQRIAAAKAWTAKNKDARRSISQQYKHKRRAQESSGVTYSEFHSWKRTAEKRCHWCGQDCTRRYEVDHYIPLSRGGLHAISNFVIACRPCNARKSNKMPEQFLAEIRAGKIDHITGANA